MLDIVHNYAQKWRYNLNAEKSVVMVFGETSRTRRLASSARKWTLGDEVLKEVDEQHHLGILRTVFNSTIHRTNERATAGRSTFYALNTVGSRFGRLHPLTSLKFYQALCLPLLLYGSELWTLTKTELLSLERVHTSQEDFENNSGLTHPMPLSLSNYSSWCPGHTDPGATKATQFYSFCC